MVVKQRTVVLQLEFRTLSREKIRKVCRKSLVVTSVGRTLD